MRAHRRQIVIIILVGLLVVAALAAWGFAHRSEKPSAASGQVSGLVDSPSDPQFLPAWQFVNLSMDENLLPRSRAA